MVLDAPWTTTTTWSIPILGTRVFQDARPICAKDYEFTTHVLLNQLGIRNLRTSDAVHGGFVWTHREEWSSCCCGGETCVGVCVCVGFFSCVFCWYNKKCTYIAKKQLVGPQPQFFEFEDPKNKSPNLIQLLIHSEPLRSNQSHQISPLFFWNVQATLSKLHQHHLVGGWTNPFEKYYSNWIISPDKDEHKKYLKPPPSHQHFPSNSMCFLPPSPVAHHVVGRNDCRAGPCTQAVADMTAGLGLHPWSFCYEEKDLPSRELTNPPDIWHIWVDDFPFPSRLVGYMNFLHGTWWQEW